MSTTWPSMGGERSGQTTAVCMTDKTTGVVMHVTGISNINWLLLISDVQFTYSLRSGIPICLSSTYKLGEVNCIGLVTTKHVCWIKAICTSYKELLQSATHASFTWIWMFTVLNEQFFFREPALNLKIAHAQKDACTMHTTENYIAQRKSFSS